MIRFHVFFQHISSYFTKLANVVQFINASPKRGCARDIRSCILYNLECAHPVVRSRISRVSGGWLAISFIQIRFQLCILSKHVRVLTLFLTLWKWTKTKIVFSQALVIRILIPNFKLIIPIRSPVFYTSIGTLIARISIGIYKSIHIYINIIIWT